jgi:hypothetical protein
MGATLVQPHLAQDSCLGTPGRTPGRRHGTSRPGRHEVLSSCGGIQVARQRIQVGMTHAGQTVTIDLSDTRCGG